MRVTVNGNPQQTDRGATVKQLLEQLDTPADQVAVEVNRELVPRARHATHQLDDGDEVEVVRLVGGG